MNKVILIISLALTIGLTSSPSYANNNQEFCKKTADILSIACSYDIAEDFLVKKAQCLNLGEREDRKECHEEMREDYAESRQECRDVHRAREDLCGLIGQDRYDPDIDPNDFVDPDDIGGSVTPNPYFPLVVGNRWVYEGDGEVITVIVTDKTKVIEGVTVRVVNDIVLDEDGVLIEDTDDWYAQDQAGNLWYFGEIAQNFELFDGDDPEEAELVDIDGSFKFGVDGALPGLLIRFNPIVGETIRQEVAYGEAEDAINVVSLTATASSTAASCLNSCLETLDYTPLEPGVFESKFYKPGVGLILETDPEGGILELVEFANP